MKPTLSSERAKPADVREQPEAGWRPLKSRGRLIALACCCAALVTAFAPVLFELFNHALSSEMHSHIILVPFISAYLIFVDRRRLPYEFRSALGAGLIALILGVAAILLVAELAVIPLTVSSRNDQLAVLTVAFLSLLIAAGFFFLGRSAMAAVAFPIAFLVFMIPMPDGMTMALERASQLASAEAANLLFIMFGTPFLRDGLVYRLPTITLEVAEECSGIRSSWVLLITSVLGAHMFLKSSWRRVLLAFAVIPLGVLRNGFRIWVIAVLCVEIGPEMVHSFVHRRGGPIFFALSLIPLFGLLWLLRKGEGAKQPLCGAASRRSSAPAD